MPPDQPYEKSSWVSGIDSQCLKCRARYGPRRRRLHPSSWWGAADR